MSLIKSISIEALLQRRDAIVGEITKIYEATQRIKEVLPAINGMFKTTIGGLNSLQIDVLFRQSEQMGYRDNAPFYKGENLTYAIKSIDAELWKILMHESGMLTFMNAEAREKWSKQLHKLECPALTLKNIEATFRDLADNKTHLFEQGVCQIAEKLNRNYKTNKVHKFGKKIIMNCSYGYGAQVDQLDDLDRALHILSGKPERDSRRGLRMQFSSFRERPYSIETDYLSMHVYKNLNAHITFKDLTLVDGLNKIIGKHYPNAIANEVRK